MSPQERVFYKDDDPVKVIYVAAGFSASIDISWIPGIEWSRNGPCSPVNLSSTPWLGRVCLSAPNVCENLQLSGTGEIFKDFFFPSWKFSIVSFLFVNRSKKDNNKKSANFGYVGREAINTKTNLLHQLIWHLEGVRGNELAPSTQNQQFWIASRIVFVRKWLWLIFAWEALGNMAPLCNVYAPFEKEISIC